MTKLADMTIDEAEAALAHCIDLAEGLPKSEESRRIYNQVHARTIQERIDDLEAMRRDSLGGKGGWGYETVGMGIHHSRGNAALDEH